MRIFLFAIIFLFGIKYVLAQQGESILTKQAKEIYKEANQILESSNSSEQTRQIALTKFQKAANLFIQAGSKDRMVADTYLKIGIAHEGLNSFPKAINFYLTSLHLRRQSSPIEDSSYFKNYVYLGSVYYKVNLYDSASYFYQKAEWLAQRYPKLDAVKRLYNALGAMHYIIGNYHQSINYFNKALFIASQSPNHSQSIIATYSINIASSYSKLGLYEEALRKYKTLLSYKHLDLNTLYLNIGKAYTKIGRYDSALLYLNKAEFNNNLSLQLKLYIILGDLYSLNKQYLKGLTYYNQVIKLNNQVYSLRNSNLAHAYIGKGQVREAQGHVKAALSYYHLAVQALHFNFNTNNMLRNPEDFAGAVSRLDLFEALRHKARGWRLYYSQTKQLSHLKASLKTYELALKLANQIRRSYDSDEAKLFFANNVFPAFEEAIAVSYQLYGLTGNAVYAQTAFAFSEGSKAAVLAETLRGLDIRNARNVPVSLLNEERELRRKITKLTIATMEAKDTTQTQRYRDQSRDLEIQLAQVLKRMEKNSAYYQLKYQDGNLDVAQLQSSLVDSHTALVEYFLGSQEVYAFIITQDQFETIRIPLNAAYRQAFSQLRRELYVHQPGRSNRTTWAYSLYQQLITPIKDKIKDKERLIIVPDGELNYLPFEALTADREGQAYLLRDFTVQYAYSASLLQRAYQHDKTLQNSSLLAMAPFADSTGSAFRSTHIVPLPASRQEVENIGGRVYLKSDATKELFLKVAQSYGVIHLATHAKADSDEPLNSYITFYPKNADSLAGYRLYTNELYNLRLDSAKLVVLSACETGGGRLVRGEGVMSLARAFAYAGCPSIVMTLWKAEDRTTGDIIARMHTYLKKGYRKDEALRQAKLDFLDSDLPDYRKEPYFWANFVFIGNNEPIYSNHNWIWITVAAVILVILGWFIYRRTRFISSY